MAAGPGRGEAGEAPRGPARLYVATRLLTGHGRNGRKTTKMELSGSGGKRSYDLIIWGPTSGGAAG